MEVLWNDINSSERLNISELQKHKRYLLVTTGDDKK